MKNKVISLRLEFSLRGKRRTPTVGFITTEEEFGVPLTSHNAREEENAAFAAFSKAAHEFCRQMKIHGEFL